MKLVILSAFRQTLQSVGEAFGTMTDGLSAAGAAAAGWLVVYLLPVIAAIVFSVFFTRKRIKGALAVLLLAIYGGLEFLLSSGRVAVARGSSLMILGELALTLGLSLLVCLIVYALFHRKSRRRLPPDYYEEDEEEEEGEHEYAAFDDYYRR